MAAAVYQDLNLLKTESKEIWREKKRACVTLGASYKKMYFASDR